MLGMGEIDLMNYYPLFKKKVKTNEVWSYDAHESFASILFFSICQCIYKCTKVRKQNIQCCSNYLVDLMFAQKFRLKLHCHPRPSFPPRTWPVLEEFKDSKKEKKGNRIESNFCFAIKIEKFDWFDKIQKIVWFV